MAALGISLVKDPERQGYIRERMEARMVQYRQVQSRSRVQTIAHGIEMHRSIRYFPLRPFLSVRSHSKREGPREQHHERHKTYTTGRLSHTCFTRYWVSFNGSCCIHFFSSGFVQENDDNLPHGSRATRSGFQEFGRNMKERRQDSVRSTRLQDAISLTVTLSLSLSPSLAVPLVHQAVVSADPMTIDNHSYASNVL